MDNIFTKAKDLNHSFVRLYLGVRRSGELLRRVYLADLPAEVQSLIAYRNSESEEAQALIAGGLDNVRWDLLSDAAMGPSVWAALARKMGPQALRKFAGIVLVSDNESWVRTGRHGSTGVMTTWEAFVANQRKLAGKEASPKLINIDLQPYQTVQACERADIMNIGGFSDSEFNVISAFLADNNQRFVAEVEAIEL